MRYNLAQSLFWIACFTLLALFPVTIALLGPLPTPRDYWVEFGALLGFLGLAVLNLQCVITGRFRWFAGGFGFDNLLEFHKRMGIFALVLILAHPGILITADREFLAFFDPRENFPRAAALSVITVISLVLIASSLWRLTFRLNYERWRLLHGALSLGIIFLGLGHVVMVNHYGEPLWKKGALVLMSGSAMYLIVHSRIVRPWLMKRRPYRIVEVRPQRNDSHTLVIEPEGPHRLNHHAGQFLWITIGPSPYSMQQHPFSIASRPGQPQLELTIKGLGDFTKTVGKIEPGTRAWLEGPYGRFYHKPDEYKGAVFIAGGVGVTPIMSHLRDIRDRGDNTPCVFFDGNEDWEDVMFREEIEEMPATMQLKVVHVLSKPTDDWKGETGYVDEAVLKRHLPSDYKACAFFICGPGPLLDSGERTLVKLGVPARAIFTERFDMV